LVGEYSPEQIPDAMPLYFPVGISKDGPSWEKVLACQEHVAKPVDIYSYLFWLNQQGRPVDLVVCDSMQVTNYQSLYGYSPEAAGELVAKIGAAERQQYEQIVAQLGLTNIRVRNYDGFVQKDGAAFGRQRELCQRLARNPIWSEAMLAMVQESVGSKEDRQKYLPYALEELTWILATNGTKISHLNEARYDVVAAMIKSVVAAAEADGIDPYNPSQEAALTSYVKAVYQELANIINRKKSDAAKAGGRESAEFQYYERAYDHLRKIKVGKEAPAQNFDKKKVIFDFYCPEVGSRSFGWRSVGAERTEGVIKFKEPYSTYFYDSPAEMFLDSDQVVAVSEGHIAGKILTLEPERQRQYVEKTIKPLLVGYFKNLETAPASYFAAVGKKPEEIMAECLAAETLPELLHFIQRYIVAPTMVSAQVESSSEAA
jgi:hypothetical protein